MLFSCTRTLRRGRSELEASVVILQMGMRGGRGGNMQRWCTNPACLLELEQQEQAKLEAAKQHQYMGRCQRVACDAARKDVKRLRARLNELNCDIDGEAQR
eukprot:6198325-Pleurochrysis_carterae.AAC.3